MNQKKWINKPRKTTIFKNKTFIDSFNNAVNGLKFVFKNERNFKIHIAAAILVFLFSLFMDFSSIELLLITITVSFVFFAEIINTAIESIVNTMIKVYHPKAKIIKDVAASGVLIASINSIVVAHIVFVGRLDTGLDMVIDRLRRYPPHIALISIILTVVVVILLKLLYNKGTPFKGGMPSGHTAVAFVITTSIALWFQDVTLILLCLALSLLVAQSRIEGKIHNTFEVVAGALVGILITVFVFSVINYTLF
jgi:diacylglycerol kinase (ATP)